MTRRPTVEGLDVDAELDTEPCAPTREPCGCEGDNDCNCRDWSDE